MKYLKEYNIFLRNIKKICDRCNNSTKILSQSMYNKQNICLDCKRLENEGNITADDLRDIEDDYFTTNMPMIPQTTKSQNIKYL